MAWEDNGLCVDPNTPPMVSFTNPIDGSTIAINSTVELSVNANDADGQIVSTQFYVNGEMSSSTWTATQRGENTLRVVVTDNANASAEETITVFVNNPDNQKPITYIGTPFPDQELEENDLVALTAVATDSDGSIERVEFILDNEILATITEPPYIVNWTVKDIGSHTIASIAYDDWNDSTTSEVVPFTVKKGNQLPTSSLTSPGPDQHVLPGNTILFAADANDEDGSIALVEFLVNGEVVGSDDTAPYEFTWTAVGEGDVSVTAKAYDNRNWASLSAAVNLWIGEPITDHNICRPDGLVGDSLYCKMYDEDGREKMGDDHARRIIGYFTSWRNGANGLPTYLVKDIPWDKLTHINYAFAHVGPDKTISIGNPNNPNNPATGMEWPGVAGAEMDPTLSYKGHLNLMTKYKKMYPDVKTLISVGGWAETGGYFDEDGTRVADGGFYTLTENEADMITFADSCVDFVRTYGFDGVDIDYEYATSNMHAGNPDDFWISNSRRAVLFQEYDRLMEILREKLDAAGKEDKRHYLLTVAAPASGWLLRGQETYQMVRFLDFVNLMSYDLHGAWNEHVGHNAALFDTGEDAEIDFWRIYDTPNYGGIGYLNTDWAFHYYRGSLPAGRINIGIPYYTRGWQNVDDKNNNNGLWGSGALPNQDACPPGTGMGKNVCGYGAKGIDNLWHDLDINGEEVLAGVVPMWHAKNLENGHAGSYLENWGLTPDTDPSDTLTGQYVRHWDDVAKASWLWNEEKKVYLSTEDEQAMEAKTQYVIDKGIGGIMFWELAGDFDFHQDRNNGQGEFYMGYTMTNLAYDAFKNASPYGNKKAERPMPTTVIDIIPEFTGFREGDQNYPIEVTLNITNNSSATLPEGAEISFDAATSAPDKFEDSSGNGVHVSESGANAGGGNIGGAENTFHRVAFNIPQWVNIAPGQSWSTDIKWQMPISTPSNWTITLGGETYGFKYEHPTAEEYDPGTGGDIDCEETSYSPGTQYAVGDEVSHNGKLYRCLIGPWCSSSATMYYEPGVGSVWESTWTETGDCTPIEGKEE